jgi:cell division protein FtsQ
MWDDPRALRKLSNALFAIAVALLAFGVLHYAIHLPLFALRTVQLQSPPQRVAEADVAWVVRNELRGNFFTVDLEQVRRDLERLPWVRKVDVRRHFPWQLDVALEEQVALAHWNGTRLLNTYGEIFAATSEQSLPELSGPDAAAAEVAQRYTRFNEMLAPLKQQVAQLSLSPRGAWELRLQDGMVMELGREQMEQRLARFVAVYPYSLAAMQVPLRYVDLRYRNGFAVSLPAARGQG